MVDLHTHSNASDGGYSPAQLIREAKNRGLGAIALTDHDTLDGLESAGNEAKAAGIRFIRGIEVNIDRYSLPGPGKNAPGNGRGIGAGGEFHLLGLGLTSPTPAFLDAVAELARGRQERNRKILDRMHELSIEATWEEVLALSGGRPAGRLHFAALLVRKKIVRTTEQAFARYLRPGKPLYEPKSGLTFEQAAALIRESGGIPVLAHPMSLYVAWGRFPELLKALKERGLMGIEAWHPNAIPKSCRRLEETGKSIGLHITEGSDFHGDIRPDRKMGYSNRNRQIDDSILEAIPELR